MDLQRVLRISESENVCFTFSAFCPENGNFSQALVGETKNSNSLCEGGEFGELNTMCISFVNAVT